MSFYTDRVGDVVVGGREEVRWEDVDRMFGGGGMRSRKGAENGRDQEEGEEEVVGLGQGAGAQEDTRFAGSSLPIAQKRALFHRHVSHLRDKYRMALHGLFLDGVMRPVATISGEQDEEDGERKAPVGAEAGIGLERKWDDLSESTRKSLEGSLPAIKLGLGSSSSSSSASRDNDRHRRDRESASPLEREFAQWQSERTQLARTDFQKLLEENSFVEFWGKVGKSSHPLSAAKGKNQDGDDDGEDEEGDEGGKRGFAINMGSEDLGMDLDAEGDIGLEGGRAGGEGEGDDGGVGGGKDLKALAKSIGLEEVERVLKNDRRYRAFDHVKEERSGWIRVSVLFISTERLMSSRALTAAISFALLRTTSHHFALPSSPFTFPNSKRPHN